MSEPVMKYVMVYVIIALSSQLQLATLAAFRTDHILKGFGS
jgi:hypothetical protein